jgi:uncharacterized protein YndB with AHSA1/START domain
VNTYDEDQNVNNEVTEVEVFIEQPVGKVWAQFLDMESWVITHNIEEITEARRTVGAITRVAFRGAKELGYPPAHHHYCKIIKMVPERQYVLKTYSEKGGSYGASVVGFDDARFFAVDGGTRIRFSYFGEHRNESAVKKSAGIDMEVSVEGMRKNLENLKRIVEGRA